MLYRILGTGILGLAAFTAGKYLPIESYKENE